MDGWDIPEIGPCDNFGPAAKGREDVYGCGRPYEFKVDEWIQVVREEGISRIVVLCEPKDYSYFIDKFEDEFGQKNVLRATVTDYHLCEKELLNNEIIPFINQSIEQNEKVVVHCNAGSGRTGHVLAAWLYSHEGDVDVSEARKSVSRPGGRGYVSRNPSEAVICGNATLEDLENLIRSTRE